MAMHNRPTEAKALLKFACTDKTRRGLYGRYAVADGRGTVSNGQVAAYWSTARASGIYTVDTDDRVDAEYPDKQQCLPSRAEKPTFSGVVCLPIDCKKGNYTLARLTEGVAPIWICVVPGQYDLPKGVTVIVSLAGQYLAAITALLGDSPYIEVRDPLSPVLFSKEPVTEYAACDLYAIVMPVCV